MKVHHQRKKPKANQVVKPLKQKKLHQRKILIKKLKMILVSNTDGYQVIYYYICLATGDEDNTGNEDASPSKKTKGKPGRKQDKKTKTTEKKDHDQEIEYDYGNHQLFLFRFKCSQLCLEMKDESDAAVSDKKTPIGRKGKATSTTKKGSENDENADPIDENLNLSEDEDSADDTKENTTTTKKGPTKRSAPSSDKKTGATTGKKRSAEDDPFDDRTNADESAEAENMSEDGSLIHIDY
jgi:hypothetical protein